MPYMALLHLLCAWREDLEEAGGPARAKADGKTKPMFRAVPGGGAGSGMSAALAAKLKATAIPVRQRVVTTRCNCSVRNA